MRQIHDEEVGLLLDAANHHNCFAEIRLRVPRRVGERHEHLPAAQLPVPDIVLDDRIAAGEAPRHGPRTSGGSMARLRADDQIPAWRYGAACDAHPDPRRATRR